MLSNTIDIIDCGYGNMGSIVNMLKKIGVTSKICSKGSDLVNSKKIILPGVGSFDKGMSALERHGFDDAIINIIQRHQIPCLAICLGMQLLFDRSEEGEKNGLGIISGNIKKFSTIGSNNGKIRVPNMGWRTIDSVKPNKLIVQTDPYSPRFYFCHTYYASVMDDDIVMANSFHGSSFPAFIQKNNFFCVQFHPEKSLRFGFDVIKNFIAI